MSLYHEASQILATAVEQGGSLKSLVFGKRDWKTDKKTLFALSTEAAKWSEVLSEVVEKSDLLRIEKQLTPVLSLVLVHDLLLPKKGIALPAKHGLHSAISKHKGRLSSELTKARLRRGCPSVEVLRDHINSGALTISKNSSSHVHPRWIRINTLLTTLARELTTTFAGFREVSELSAVTTSSSSKESVIYLDPNVPSLVAVPSAQDFSTSTAYKDGRIIFQEKASCFPAYLLDPEAFAGDVIDACAAPGNKTTHLAALAHSTSRNSDERRRRIFACEKDAARSNTLASMVKLAGAADTVAVRARQDFMKLDPLSPEYTHVEGLLLDPSCSGSGIVGRDEVSVTIHLPSRDNGKEQEGRRGKKRKRSAEVKLDTRAQDDGTTEETAQGTSDEDESKVATRLANLSSFQLRLLQHAMAFPSAKRITYSTCSPYKEENEHVVTRALLSDIARERGWRILRREDQVEGLRSWELRGERTAVLDIAGDAELDGQEVAEACIRCGKGGTGGTMGFFVAGFVMDDSTGAGNLGIDGSSSSVGAAQHMNGHSEAQDADEDEDEWEGFSDSDG